MHDTCLKISKSIGTLDHLIIKLGLIMYDSSQNYLCVQYTWIIEALEHWN